MINTIEQLVQQVTVFYNVVRAREKGHKHIYLVNMFEVCILIISQLF
jgi:hypothetical protein